MRIALNRLWRAVRPFVWPVFGTLLTIASIYQIISNPNETWNYIIACSGLIIAIASAIPMRCSNCGENFQFWQAMVSFEVKRKALCPSCGTHHTPTLGNRVLVYFFTAGIAISILIRPFVEWFVLDYTPILFIALEFLVIRLARYEPTTT